MKAFNSILALMGLILPAVMAQFPAGFPECGKVCVNNMLAKAGTEFNCGSGDVKCLCMNQNFGYGIRDCSYQYCQNDTAAGIIVQYGLDICKQAGVTIPMATGPAATGTGGGSGSGAGGGAAGGGSATMTSAAGGAGGQSVPVTTSSFTSVITSGGSTITSSGATTIYSSASALTTSAVVTTITSGTSTITSTGSVTLSGAGTKVTGGPSSRTSAGFAPQMTPAPVGLLAAAGLAALLL